MWSLPKSLIPLKTYLSRFTMTSVICLIMSASASRMRRPCPRDKNRTSGRLGQATGLLRHIRPHLLATEQEQGWSMRRDQSLSYTMMEHALGLSQHQATHPLIWHSAMIRPSTASSFQWQNSAKGLEPPPGMQGHVTQNPAQPIRGWTPCFSKTLHGSTISYSAEKS